MSELVSKLFSSEFMPHGYCYLWHPGILWLHAVSDSVIALAYYFIPVTLIYFVRRRRDLPFHWIFIMFGIFILGCGTTHLVEVWTIWHGTYWLAGVVKALTATASLATAIVLIPLVPHALALPSPAQLRDANRTLEAEVAHRRHVEEALQRARDELELRVVERTAELAESNEQLRGEIAERRRAEEALQKTRTELAHASRWMTMVELATSIAHEMNQPLTAVVLNGHACLRLLAGPSPELAEVREAINGIIHDGNRAARVIEQVRNVIRQNGRTNETIDVSLLIGEAVDLIREEAKRNQIALEKDLAPGLPAIFGDRVHLQQVILNLMMNAIEAMQNIIDRPRVLIVKSRLHISGQSIMIAVEDTGCGLGSQVEDQMFEPFFTTKPGRLGMGLPICRSIVARHNGCLSAEPNGGYGMTFQFTVPTAEEVP